MYSFDALYIRYFIGLRPQRSWAPGSVGGFAASTRRTEATRSCRFGPCARRRCCAVRDRFGSLPLTRTALTYASRGKVGRGYGTHLRLTCFRDCGQLPSRLATRRQPALAGPARASPFDSPDNVMQRAKDTVTQTVWKGIRAEDPSLGIDLSLHFENEDNMLES